MADQIVSGTKLNFMASEMADIEKALVELRDAMRTPQTTDAYGRLSADQKTTLLLTAVNDLRNTIASCGSNVAPSCYYHDIERGN